MKTKLTKSLTTYRARVADTLPHFESLKAKLNHLSPVKLSTSDVIRVALLVADSLTLDELRAQAGRAEGDGQDGER